jgi:SAM-dependent methyltransferase
MVRFMRSVWSYHRVKRLVAALTRNSRFFVRLKQPGLILDVGCGPNMHAANLNLDYEWREGVDVCWDIAKPLPLEAGYVGGIFAEHCLEHVPFETTLFAMGEFFRVLAPGKYIRIVVSKSISINISNSGKSAIVRCRTPIWIRWMESILRQ